MPPTFKKNNHRHLQCITGRVLEPVGTTIVKMSEENLPNEDDKKRFKNLER